MLRFAWASRWSKTTKHSVRRFTLAQILAGVRDARQRIGIQRNAKFR